MREPARRDARSRFDKWSSTYEGSLIWRLYFTPLHDMLEARIGAVRGSSIVDLGSGTGDMLRRFERAGASQLLGVDESEGMLAVARGLASDNSKIEYALSSVESIPADSDQFDIAISCVAFHHFPDPLATLVETKRVLKPGGRLYVCDLTDKGLLGRSFLAFGRAERSDESYFSLGSLSELAAQAGLEVRLAEQVRAFPPTILVHASKP